MSAGWDVAAARARGLATHLLDEGALAELRRAPDVRSVQRALRETDYERFLPDRDATAATLDRAVARLLADRTSTIARWVMPEALAPLFLEEDARSVRAILRGMVGGSAVEQRLAGTMPTPSLDARALETLAGADGPGSVAATLTAWGHPYGSPLLDESARARPDAFHLEIALSRAFAREATRAARRHGGPQMRSFVRDSIDVRNVVAALLLAGTRTESDAGEVFLEGGARPDADDFAVAAASASRADGAEILRVALAGTALAAPLAVAGASASAFSRAALDARIERLGREQRSRPLSAVPVLLLALRLRREGEIVRRAVWRASLRHERAA